MVYWLGFNAFTAVAWVQSLVGELRSRKPHGTAKKKDKDLEMRSSWIGMGPTSSDKCPYERQKRRHRDTGAVKPEAEIGTKLPPAKECLESPEL